MSGSDNDSQERFALGFLAILITVLLASVVSTVVYKRGIARSADASAGASVVQAPQSVIEVDSARVVVEGGVVKFYFASAQAELAADANQALAGIVEGARAGKRVQISGFHDATGSAEINAELAKKRAQAVFAALQDLGVVVEQMELRKPEQMQASGSNAEARRVEVIVLE
ncbi:OmpA family protein [Comamonas composti]|uniref:OmpA family protein n=1 Tax=Comamonas composti TaxID=408558 RepID=UPI00042A1E5C|nr:OmpA family protein [Comamonas composti]